MDNCIWKRFCKCFVYILALAVMAPAWAQSWPSKPIHLIAPFPPGQAVDVLGRLVAHGLSRSLNTTFIVENKPGAGGTIGTAYVAKAAANGYTLLVAGNGPIAISQTLYRNPEYNTLKDLAPIASLVSLPVIFCVNASSPIKNMNDLIRHAKTEPDKTNFGSSGNGSAADLTMAVFESMAGVKLTHIPYKGSLPAINALIGGRITAISETTPAVLPFIKSGKIRAIGVSTARRIPSLQDVPTVAEQGMPGYDVTSWAGLFAPAGTPSAILDRLNEEVAKLFRNPDFLKRVEDLGMFPTTGTRDSFTAYVKSQVAAWRKAVKISGATIQ